MSLVGINTLILVLILIVQPVNKGLICATLPLEPRQNKGGSSEKRPFTTLVSYFHS